MRPQFQLFSFSFLSIKKKKKIPTRGQCQNTPFLFLSEPPHTHTHTPLHLLRALILCSMLLEAWRHFLGVLLTRLQCLSDFLHQWFHLRGTKIDFLSSSKCKSRLCTPCLQPRGTDNTTTRINLKNSSRGSLPPPLCYSLGEVLHLSMKASPADPRSHNGRVS